MAWLTLALRKQTLKAEINAYNYEDIQLSRKVRSVHRKLSYDQTVYETLKKKELRVAKKDYMDVRNSRPTDLKSDDYAEWQVEYAEAQEDYQAQKEAIEEYYDKLNEEIETEAQDEEDFIQDQITAVETQRDAENAELQAITDQIKSEIEASAIKF